MKTARSLKRMGSGLTVPSCLAFALIPLLPFLLICSVVYAEDGADPGGPGGQSVMRVEEDWEVLLNEPGSDLNSPQFHTVMSPYLHLGSYFLQVCWNYREQTDFTAGGMQLQAWLGDSAVGKKDYREDKLSTVAETVTWTQSMQTNGTVLTFGIDNGCSTTWGTFGGSETSLSGNVGIPNLDWYRTSTSKDNSWISYGANRVNLLRIKEVRRYDINGNLLSRDDTPQIVYQLTE